MCVLLGKGGYKMKVRWHALVYFYASYISRFNSEKNGLNQCRFMEVIAKRIAHAVLSLFWTTLLVSVIYKHVHKYENYCMVPCKCQC